MRNIYMGLVLLVLLFIVAISFSPIEFGATRTDSMEPTISENELFFILPTTDVEEGDVVVFFSAKKQSHVTHRIVGQNERGFITKGDKNQITDQSAGEAPVRPKDIRGKVATFGETVLTIPHAAAVLDFIEKNRGILFSVIIMLVMLDFLKDRIRYVTSKNTRRVLTYGDLLFYFTLVITISSILFISIPVMHNQTIVVSDTGVLADRGVTVNEQKTMTFTFLKRYDIPGTNTYVGAKGYEVEDYYVDEETAKVIVNGKVGPYDSIGGKQVTTNINQAPVTMPTSLQSTLFKIHPIVGATGTVISVMLPLYLILHGLLPSSTPINWRPIRSIIEVIG